MSIGHCVFPVSMLPLDYPITIHQLGNIMEAGAISIFVESRFSLGEAFNEATRLYKEQLVKSVAGKESFTISTSQSSGFIPGVGFYVSIIGTAIYS